MLTCNTLRSRACLLAMVAFLGVLGVCPGLRADEPVRLKVLFLGDDGHHQPMQRFRILQPVMARRGIDVTFTDGAAALNPATLAKYDVLLLYANIDKITPDQEQALLDYVAGGKGFVSVHCASFCFRNSDKFVKLLGAQFQKHGTGVFRTDLVNTDHPVMKGFRGFESWDETYVHTRHHDEGRTVLEYRADKAGKEPWTWVRSQGKGRVFYTAWGHDARTWNHVGFQNLLERAIRWAARTPVNDSVIEESAAEVIPQMTPRRKDATPFKYVDVGNKIPNYQGNRGGGKTLSKMQLPLEPAESLTHAVTPVDFDIRIFAADPRIRRPICMNWDERGRLWIVESVDYPNDPRPRGKGRDRIVICEDTTGNGQADKFTVFADKLSIPTGITFYKGGVIVLEAPNTLFLKDTDGDDVADVRRVLFTGWGTRDTHAGPSNLRWGFDNWIYGIVGYSGFNGVVGGERHKFGQGFFRFLPDGSKLEFLRSTNNNSWGLGFSEEGLLFGSTANGNPSVYMPIPNRYYDSVRGWSSSVSPSMAGNAAMHPITNKVRQVDWHGHFTAAAGHALYTARQYPRYYWNRTAFVCEPTGHLVATFRLDRDGSNVTSRNAWNLLASDDEWTAPIMAEVGPDGNVWIIDWYNYIVQHNPTPIGFKTGKGNAYETDLRDKKHGRIYRLVPKDAKESPALPTKSATLAKATPAQLVTMLSSDNLFWRLHAQRLLVERGKTDVVPDLIAAVANGKADVVGIAAGPIHALWTLHGLGVLKGPGQANDCAVQALGHASSSVRRNAALTVAVSKNNLPHLMKLLQDADPHVRLAALLALSDAAPDEQAGAAVAELMRLPQNMGDRWIADAATSAAAAHDVGFLQAILASDAKRALAPAMLERVALVAEHHTRGSNISPNQLAGPLSKADPKIAEVVIAALANGPSRAGKVELSDASEKALQSLLPRLSTSGQGQLFRLVKLWGSKSLANQAAKIADSLKEILRSDKESDANRLDAARQLLKLRGDADTVAAVLAPVSPRTSSSLSIGLLESLAAGGAPTFATQLLQRMSELTPTVRVAAVRVLLSRPESTLALLDAFDKGQVTLADLSLDQRQALAVHPDRNIASRAKKLLARGGGLPSADRQKVLEALLPLCERTGDPAQGKLVFKKYCAVCHTHQGEGNKVGPDLTGMAAHPKTEMLVHIIDPSRSVEGNYRIYALATLDGRIYSGLLTSESKGAVELIDSQAKKFTIQRDNIDQLIVSNKSLMPEGFEKQLSKDDLVNLLEFLRQRGKYVPLSLDKVASAVSTQGMFYRKNSTVERLVFPDWSPRTFHEVPFHLVDPRGPRGNPVPNVILFHSNNGTIPPAMPKKVKLPYSGPARSIHLLSGVSGWGFPVGSKGSVSLIARLHYADGKTEDHELKNGIHFADYIRRVDVPQSEFAFALSGRQLRYLAIHPKREDPLTAIEFIKGDDASAPIIMAVTVEPRP